MKISVSRILLGAIIACASAQIGCVRSTRPPGGGQQSESTPRQALSAPDAAVLAAQLANEQCERQYRRRPFKPEQHSAIFQGGRYHWGGLDVGGAGGFSAVVTFRRDGSEPHVEVYFSSDAFARTARGR